MLPKSILLCCILPFVFFRTSYGAETITGHACYRFSDNESIIAARDIALSMAKRDALEGYSVFVESSSTVENTTLKNDLITSLTAGLMRNIRVVNESEDLGKREICKSIVAEVDEIEIKQNIASRINLFRRQHSNIPTGLPVSDRVEVVKIRESDKNLIIVVVCLMDSMETHLKYGTVIYTVRVTYFDEDGIPDESVQKEKFCKLVGNVHKFSFPIPASNYNFLVELPD